MTVSKARIVPPEIDDFGKQAFLEIAARAREEQANAYTLLALGSQSYLDARRLGLRPSQ
jgi:hypothetical protein